MMDDGWWKKVQKVQKVRKVYMDGWWLKVHKVQNETYWWRILTRHFIRNFDETSWPDILTRHIGGLWKTLMTCNDHWYGDDFNEMASWQLWLSLVYIMCKIVQNHWYIICKAKIGHYPYIGLYIKLLDFVDFAVQAAVHS